MVDYACNVLVCTNSEGAEDKRHCGDKGGPALHKRFNELLARHKLLDKVTVCDVGCTSQHKQCERSQGTVIVYGPRPELGGTWYIASPDDVEEIIAEHVVKGRVVDRLLNRQRSVRFS